MRTYIYTIMVLVMGLAFTSCGNDEPDPIIEEEEELFGFGLLNEENLIDGANFVTVPEAMAAVSDQCALTTTALVYSSNAYLFYQVYFFPLLTDNKSTSPIESMAGHSNYRVYEWNLDGQTSLAIQLSESGNNNYHTVFARENGGAYFKFIETRESKDKKNGQMEIFDDTQGNVVSFRYSWQLNDDGSREIITEEPQNSSYWVYVKNQPDFSGEMEFRQAGENTKEVTWDNLGNGSWKEFDETGNLVDEGSWSI